MDTDPATESTTTLHERVGGDATFFALVDAFYAGVERDPPLRAVYPDDLGPGKEALALFLAQRFGGPPTYSQRKGHPRLRMRHAPFTVTPDGARRWIAHFLAAIDEVGITGLDADELRSYATQFAPTMVNTPDATPEGLPLA